MRIHRLIPPIMMLMVVACTSSPDAAPSPSTPVARGEAMARRLCADCHAAGRFDRSDHTDAPPFRHLSDLYPVEDLAEAMVEGLMTGHPDMPEFQFSPDAAADFIAYLQSIQQPGSYRHERGD